MTHPKGILYKEKCADKSVNESFVSALEWMQKARICEKVEKMLQVMLGHNEEAYQWLITTLLYSQ